ncbi:MAG: dTMP kinase [Bacteroidales bacterium]|jgi:dTMP kinase|nr:dTMP kinase [Bacteroidales bacterium]
MGLIVIEGLDGAGKSTQINKLHQWLSAKGKRCRMLHFPRTDSPTVFGELIARFLRGELGDRRQVNPYLAAMIYAGDRFDCKPELDRWLHDGDMVLLDRYVYSNIAYQCAKLQDEKEKTALQEWILHLEFEYYALPKPDLNIFLDVPFDFTRSNLSESRKGDDRQYLRGKRDIHESSLRFQENVRQMYLSLADATGLLKIECGWQEKMLSEEDIFDKIIKCIKEIIKT